MHNISLIEIKYCIWEKANTNGAKWKVGIIRGAPQLERGHKNLRRVYELIKQGPEQYSSKGPRIPSYGPAWYILL